MDSIDLAVKIGTIDIQANLLVSFLENFAEFEMTYGNKVGDLDSFKSILELAKEIQTTIEEV